MSRISLNEMRPRQPRTIRSPARSRGGCFGSEMANPHRLQVQGPTPGRPTWSSRFHGRPTGRPVHSLGYRSGRSAPKQRNGWGEASARCLCTLHQFWLARRHQSESTAPRSPVDSASRRIGSDGRWVSILRKVARNGRTEEAFAQLSPRLSSTIVVWEHGAYRFWGVPPHCVPY